MNPLRTLLLVVAITCAAMRVAPAQDDRRLDEARARWEQLTPEQREQMRERFERFRQMPPEHRQAMEDRARFLRESMRRAEERLSPEERARLAALAPNLRVEVLRDLAMLEGRDRGARIHGALPEAWRERLERVPAEERARVLGEMQQKMREQRRGEQRERGGPPGEPGQDARSRDRSPEPLAARLRKLGLSPEEIARIEALPEADRRREIEKLRPRATGAEGSRRGPESTPARRRLMEAARPRASDILRLADRPTPERRELIAKIVRERIVQVLRAEQLATAQEIEALEKLSLEDFRRVMREKFAVGGPQGDGRHGDGRRGDAPPPPGPPRER